MPAAPAKRLFGARVEIIEPASESGGDPAVLPAIKPTRVRVNGTDVGLLQPNGITVDPGNEVTPASVSLKLWVTSVEIKAE